jgi:hypothetical protein
MALFISVRLEAACCRALTFGDPSYKTVKGILVHGLDQQESPVPVVLPPAASFARSPGELVGTLAEVLPWN